MSVEKYKKIFKQKRNYSIGVEEEFMICDPQTGELINKANDIMNAVSDKDRYSLAMNFMPKGNVVLGDSSYNYF